MRTSTPPLPTVSLLATAWIVGTAAGGAWLGFGPGYSWVMLFLLVGLGLASGYWAMLFRSPWRPFVVLLSGFLGGVVSFGLHGLWASPTDLSALVGQKVEVRGDLWSTPIQKENRCTHTLRLSELVWQQQRYPVRGKLIFSLPACQGGVADTLALSGKLTRPQNAMASDFDYVGYLARQRIYYQLDRPEVLAQATAASTDPIVLLTRWNQQVEGRINRLWPERESALLAGILIGARRGFDEATTLAMARTGTTHIVAISGYNITIIIVLLSLVLGRFLPRKRLFVALSLGIVLFVLFVGASASVVRAGWMGWLYLLASRVGHPAKVASLLLLAAWVMLILDPLQLWDVGFQLSVLATAGLIIFYPLLSAAFTRRFGDYRQSTGLGLLGQVWLTIRLYVIETLLVTLAAQILVLPLLVLTFGEFSVLSLFTNVAVLFAIPVVMATGLSTLFFVIIMGSWGETLAFPLWLITERLLWYMLQVIGGLSNFPLALLNLEGFGKGFIWVWLLLSAGFVAKQIHVRRLL